MDVVRHTKTQSESVSLARRVGTLPILTTPAPSADSTFDRDHPGVYEAFRRMAWAWAQRSKRGSARYLIHKMRWETRLGTFRDKDDYAVNDHWALPLGKRFMAEFPDHANFFQTRDNKAAKAACRVPRPYQLT